MYGGGVTLRSVHVFRADLRLPGPSDVYVLIAADGTKKISRRGLLMVPMHRADRHERGSLRLLAVQACHEPGKGRKTF